MSTGTRRAGLTLVGMLTALLVAWLAVLLGLRVPFRCDLYVWSESPFMTDMLKLAQGRSIYSAVADMNSFVYAPGLHYLTYALLAPFGLALDIRWCRVISILVGVAAAATFAALATGVAHALQPGTPTRGSLALAFGVATLLVFTNFTSDVPHPDNLHALHALLTLLLTVAALRRASFPLAAAAMGVAGLGVLAKQPAALSAVGAGAALLLGRRWRPGAALAFLAIGTAATGVALVPELRTPEARFFTLWLPASHGVDPWKLITLVGDLGHGHRLVLTTLVVPSVVYLLRRGGTEGRRLVLAWACLAATTVVPALLPYLKPEGGSNDLGIVMLWFLVPCWLVLGGDWLDRPDSGAPFATPALRTTALVVLLLCLLPTRLPPSDAATAYCDRLIADIGTDLRAGRRVLLNHGTTPFIANGFLEVPLDRSNTMLELFWSANGAGWATAARERIASWQYDRIYTTKGIGSFVILDGVQRYYRVTEEIPAPAPTPFALGLPFDWGATLWVAYAADLKVYAPNDDVTLHDPGPDGTRQYFARMRSLVRRTGRPQAPAPP